MSIQQDRLELEHDEEELNTCAYCGVECDNQFCTKEHEVEYKHDNN